MMAVTTSLNNGELTITGDAADDDIAIIGTLNPGEVIVNARNGTSINGAVNGRAVITGVTGRVTVDTGAGNDFLALDNLYVAGQISLTTGAGDDAVRLASIQPVSPAGALVILTGDGNDSVACESQGVFVADSAIIRTGAGHDVVRAVGSSATRGFSVNGEDGSDSILAVRITANSIGLGGDGGSNSLALLGSAAEFVHVGAQYDGNLGADPGPNVLYVDTVFAQKRIEVVAMNAHSTLSGQRATSIHVYHCLMTQLSILGGFGANEFVLHGNSATGPSWTTHNREQSFVWQSMISVFGFRTDPSRIVDPSSNHIELTYNIAGELVVSGTDGFDYLRLLGNSMTRGTTLDGRGGENRISEFGNDFGATLTITNFS
jgi:hypothetical protein